jgi:hypothetical protein
MRYAVTILDNNTIEVFDNENPNEHGAPILRQDVHPDGRAWEDRAEAQALIDDLIVDWSKPAEETTTE